MSFKNWSPLHDGREGGRIIGSTFCSLVYLLSENKMTTLKDHMCNLLQPWNSYALDGR